MTDETQQTIPAGNASTQQAAETNLAASGASIGAMPAGSAPQFSGMGADYPGGSANAANQPAPAQAAGKPEAQPGQQGVNTSQTNAAGAKDSDKAPAPDKTAANDPAGAAKDSAQDPASQPITDWEKANIKIEGADAEVLASFGKTAVELGLTPAQVEKLADWQLNYISAAREAATKAGLAELNTEWGNAAGQNQQACNNLINKVDELLGNNAFSKAIAQVGADCNANFVRGLLALTKLTAEDSTAGSAASASGPSRPETALEGLRSVFRQTTGHDDVFGGRF